MTDRIEDTPNSATYVLTTGLIHELRTKARRRGISVSELVRELLTKALQGDTDGTAND